MGKYFEDIVAQASKQGQIVCGDNCLCERTSEGTTFVLCDGLGSGIYANIASITCAHRLLELLRSFVSLHAACEMVAESMHKARTEDIPFAAFTVAQIRHDGHFSVFSYESPPPIIIKNSIAVPLSLHYLTMSYEVIGEVSGTLDNGDSLVLVSDGVTQAGLGVTFPMGWGINGLADYINHRLSNGLSMHEVAENVVRKANNLSGNVDEDDTTCAVLHCRQARTLTILTGPPFSRLKDNEVVHRFFSQSGKRAVCGSSTSEMAAREMRRPITMKSGGLSMGSPPEYAIDGVDLVTEGAVTLNQAYNILGENPEDFDPASPVSRLCTLMQEADIVEFMVGEAVNNDHDSIIFKQMGILPRRRIVRLIIEKLRTMGKLVTEIRY